MEDNSYTRDDEVSNHPGHHQNTSTLTINFTTAYILLNHFPDFD